MILSLKFRQPEQMHLSVFIWQKKDPIFVSFRYFPSVKLSKIFAVYRYFLDTNFQRE